MRSILMQPWTTVRGAVGSNVRGVIQGQDKWLDVGPYQDAAFWIDCREVTGTVSLEIDTAPSLDEALFLAVFAPITLTAATAPVVKPATLALAGSPPLPSGAPGVPIARWLRWKLTCSSGTWDACFRIWAVVNAPGA